MLRVTSNLLKQKGIRNFSKVYPAYIVNAPPTEVSKTSNGVRVATEVIILILIFLR